MEKSAPRVLSDLEKVLKYGDQVAVVLHSFSINSGGRTRVGFDDQVNLFDASVSTLRQVTELVKKEVAGKKIFSEKGLEYVHTLALECAAELAKIEPIFKDGCLTREELSAKKKSEKKALGKLPKPPFVLNDLPAEVDEAAMLMRMERMRWTAVKPQTKKIIARLYDVQTHMLLVTEVLTLNSLTKDLSSGSADVRAIASYHSRILRTADLLYLRLPSRFQDSSDTDTIDSIIMSSSDSESDVSSIASFRPRKKRGFCPPPPPPPMNRVPPGPPPVSILPPMDDGITVSRAPPLGPSVDNVNPPSYSESHKSSTSPSDTKDSFPDEKKDAAKGETKQEEPAKPITHEGRLFKTKSTGLRFKIKSLFRSNASLAEEMKTALNDSESYLSAWLIRTSDIRPVPHSAFHSLEATHMRTILSQLNNDDWYKTFLDLNTIEHNCLDRIVKPDTSIGAVNREVIVLKVVQQNRGAAWMALLREILKQYPSPPGSGRVLLAIVREKLIDGKPPLPANRFSSLLPPPPPPPGWRPSPIAPVIPAMRPPPSIQQPLARTRIIDLSFPYHPPMGPNPACYPPRPMGGPPGPPPPPNFSCPPPPPPGSSSTNAQPLVKSDSVKIIDTTPLTDFDAVEALTTFTSYSLRLAETNSPSQPRTWSRVAVTQESASQDTIKGRVTGFARSGGDVIEYKLRLTEQQSSQVTRLLEDVKFSERDVRFEWCMVEISAYNSAGLIVPDGEVDGKPAVNNCTGTATAMSVILKRSPKISQRPLELYNSLMSRPPPAPWGPRPPMHPGPPPPPMARNFRPKNRRRGYRSDSDISSSSDSDSDSDSDSSSSSSSGSGYSGSEDLRMKLRRKKGKMVRAEAKRKAKLEQKEEEKAKKAARKGKGGKPRKSSKYEYESSDEDEESKSKGKEKEKEKEEEKKDPIEIKLDLKRGDDIVQALLEMWTVQTK